MPQYRKNQCDHGYLHRSQCDQRSGQLYRRILAAYGRGRRSIPVFALPYPLRHSGDGLLLPQGKPGALQTIRFFCLDGALLKKIMHIALPNGVENGVHQLVKVALFSMVALFGTYQIAANGVAQSIWSLAAIMGLAMAPVYTTVIGQYMGAKDIDAANFYFKKLNRITLLLSILWNALIFALTPLIVRYSAISLEAKELVLWLVLINNIFNGLAYPFAGSLGSGLRAAGDVKFTMIVSIVLTIAARLLFSALFGLWLNWGVIGMSMDLVFRGGIFLWRYRSQKWTKFQLI